MARKPKRPNGRDGKGFRGILIVIASSKYPKDKKQMGKERSTTLGNRGTCMFCSLIFLSIHCSTRNKKNPQALQRYLMHARTPISALENSRLNFPTMRHFYAVAMQRIATSPKCDTFMLECYIKKKLMEARTSHTKLSALETLCFEGESSFRLLLS